MQSGAQYLVAVVNTDTSVSATESFALTGSFTGTTLAAASRSAGAPVSRSATRMPVAASAQQIAVGELPRIALQNHTAMLEENRRIYARFGNPRAAWEIQRARSGRVAPLNAAVVPTVGAISNVYVKNSFSGTCTAATSIAARTVAVGQHVIVLADTNTASWPNAYRPDSSFYQTFANEFDAITWPHIIANIGNPLAYDASLSHLGKITVAITPVLNNFASAAGGGSIVAFTNGCDFYPYAATGFDADFSNQTEIFYSWVPSASGYPWRNGKPNCARRRHTRTETHRGVIYRPHHQ